jgi:hypothetical protein
MRLLNAAACKITSLPNGTSFPLFFTVSKNPHQFHLFLFAYEV